MTDKQYIDYAKEVHGEILTLSNPMIDSIANKMLTRLRKEQKKLFPLKEEWTSCMSNVINLVDVMSILALREVPLSKMHKDLDSILNQYIMERYEELDPKSHFFVTFRFVAVFGLVDEVKERIFAKLIEHYDTQRMQSMLERYPDLTEVQPVL